MRAGCWLLGVCRERNELEQNCLEARQDLEAMKVSLQQVRATAGSTWRASAAYALLTTWLLAHVERGHFYLHAARPWGWHWNELLLC